MPNLLLVHPVPNPLGFELVDRNFIPIKPFVAESIAIGIGQRYDIVINANQDIGNYWLRADIGTQCGRNRMTGRIRSIIRYEGAPETEPVSEGIAKSTGCYDEDVTPWVSNEVPRDQFMEAVKYFHMGFNVSTVNGPLVQWLINGSDMRVDWSKPTLDYVIDGDYSFESRRNVYEINQVNAWTFWVIQTVQGDPVNIPHPIHLHGKLSLSLLTISS